MVNHTVAAPRVAQVAHLHPDHTEAVLNHRYLPFWWCIPVSTAPVRSRPGPSPSGRTTEWARAADTHCYCRPSSRWPGSHTVWCSMGVGSLDARVRREWPDSGRSGPTPSWDHVIASIEYQLPYFQSENYMPINLYSCKSY